MKAKRSRIKSRKPAKKLSRAGSRRTAFPKARHIKVKAGKAKKLTKRDRKAAKNAKIAARKSKAEERDRLKKKLEAERKALEEAARKETMRKNLDVINGLLTQAFARQAIVNLAGENSLEIIKSFDEHLTDEAIAARLKLRISDVRATLNKLHGEGLVTYMRDKDNETGWYSYTWMASGERIDQWLRERLEENRMRLNFENGQHYYCPVCGLETIYDFDSATTLLFKCPSCNKNLDFVDRKKLEEILPEKERKALALQSPK